MSEYGTPEQRRTAKNVLEALTVFNDALTQAYRLGIVVEIIPHYRMGDEFPLYLVDKMEHRQRILPPS